MPGDEKSTRRSPDNHSAVSEADSVGGAYIAIDLKSFYASVECRERGLDPMTTNLVVADVSRTEKTICLAVSPSLKAYGIPGRARLFEVVQRVNEVNRERLGRLGQSGRRSVSAGRRADAEEAASAGRRADAEETAFAGRRADAEEAAFAGRRADVEEPVFVGESYDARELAGNPALRLAYIAATPRMSLYIDYSTRIYRIYLRYIAPEDIHVYSIDEVMIDATNYLETYGISAHELARRMIRDVMQETGITATAGIGTNLYLCKVAMDIMAKKAAPDEDGVRIAQLDEMSYRRQLWEHRPLTDFWRVGRGYAKRLEAAGMYTMGDIARCSVTNEDILYRMFGVNAELLIDHAWGFEPCTMELVKAYEPEDHSFSSGQVLMQPYDFRKARVIVHEMADAVALDLVSKRMVTDQVVLTINYEQLDRQDGNYAGEVTTGWYGKKVPKHAHGSENLSGPTSSGKEIVEAALKIYDRTVDPGLLVRRITIGVNHVLREDQVKEQYEQMDLFTDYAAREKEEKRRKKERQLQEAMLQIKGRYGKNAILKGVNFEEGATGRERNRQVGGHKE